MREILGEKESVEWVLRRKSEKFDQDSIKELKRVGLSIRDSYLSISFIKRELNCCKKERICGRKKFL